MIKLNGIEWLTTEETRKFLGLQKFVLYAPHYRKIESCYRGRKKLWRLSAVEKYDRERNAIIEVEHKADEWLNTKEARLLLGVSRQRLHQLSGTIANRPKPPGSSRREWYKKDVENYRFHQQSFYSSEPPSDYVNEFEESPTYKDIPVLDRNTQ